MRARELELELGLTPTFYGGETLSQVPNEAECTHEVEAREPPQTQRSVWDAVSLQDLYGAEDFIRRGSMSEREWAAQRSRYSAVLQECLELGVLNEAERQRFSCQLQGDGSAK